MRMTTYGCNVYSYILNIPLTASPMSQGWGDDSDALASLIPLLSSHSSDDDTGGCWGSPEDALANFVAHPSGFEQTGFGEGWGSTGDALECFLGASEHLSDTFSNAGDMELMLASPPAFQTDPVDPSALAADADQWMDSDKEEDLITYPPANIKSTSCSRPPPQSSSTSTSSLTSKSDSCSDSDYKLSTHEYLPKPSTPGSNNDNPLPRKHLSEEELFIGMGPMFWDLEIKHLSSYP
jgi:hypothetical protein